MTLEELKRWADDAAKRYESLEAEGMPVPKDNFVLLLLAREFIERKTNQGGGGDAEGTSPTQVRTESAAADSFEERVKALCVEVDKASGSNPFIDGTKHTLTSEYTLASRCLRAEDALAAKDAEIARLKAADSTLRDEFQAHSDKHREEIARLTKERDAEKEHARQAAKEAQDYSANLDETRLKWGEAIRDRDAIKAALEEIRVCVLGLAGAMRCETVFRADGAMDYEATFKACIGARNRELREQTQLVAAVKSELSSVKAALDEYKSDFETWGNALNDAAWKFQEAYNAHIGGVTSAALFNNTKAVLRDTLREYFKSIDTRRSASRAKESDHA